MKEAKGEEGKAEEKKADKPVEGVNLPPKDGTEDETNGETPKETQGNYLQLF